MPRSYDLNPVAITHHPLQRIDTAIGKLPPFDLEQIVDGFLQALKDLTGIDLTGIRDFLQNVFGSIDWSHLPSAADVWAAVVAAGVLPAQITAFINTHAGINLASWDDLLASLEDGKGIDLALIPQFVRALEGIPWESGDPGAILRTIVEKAGVFLAGILPSYLGRIDIGSLFAGRPNRLAAGSFKDLASVYDNPKWQWDASVTHTADGGGSGRTTANGTERALRSNPVAVGKGQPISLSTYVKCASLAVSGAAFHLDLVRFSGTIGDENDPLVELGVERLATSSPGSGSHDWAQLSGAFTINDDDTTAVCARLVVSANCTAGTVWFDDAVLKQTGSILLSWIPEAAAKFLSIFNIFGENGLIEEMQEAWNNVLSLFGLSDKTDALGSLNRFAIWENIIEWLVKPLGLLATLVDGILPDAQKPAWLSNLTDGIANLFFGSSNTGLGISNVLESLQGIWGSGQSAQTSADNANIGVQILNARLDAVGVVGYDEFDYSSANTLPSDRYALLSEGPGGGHYGPNGKGQLVWKPSGLTSRTKIYKRTDMPLETDNGVVTAVWSTKIKDPLFSDGYGYLCGRMFDTNSDTRLQARVDNNTAVIQLVSSGVVTSIGSSASVDTKDGDVWEFWYGTLSNPYVFWLKQNGTLVRFGGQTYVEDTGHISGFLLDANHRMCGFGGRADNYAGVFQIPPPTLNGWTWRDQNVAAVA